MDPALVLAWREPPVVMVQRHDAFVVAPGWVPNWLPTRLLSAASAAALIGPSPHVPTQVRIAAWLGANHLAPACALVRQPMDAETRFVLNSWAQRYVVSSGLGRAIPAQVIGPVLVVGDPSTTVQVRAAVRPTLAALGPLPTAWVGPLIIAPTDLALPGIANGSDRLIPMAPVVRVAAGISATAAARTLADATLSLAAEGRPLPAWIGLGVGQLAEWAVSPGGLSPRTMGEYRAAADDAHMLAVMTGTARDPQLAGAIMGWCLDPRRAQSFPLFLRTILDGSTATSALLKTYPDVSTFR